MAKADETTMRTDLQSELREADEDFVRGDFVEVTVEELDRCVAAGIWPWREDSP